MWSDQSYSFQLLRADPIKPGNEVEPHDKDP